MLAPGQINDTDLEKIKSKEEISGVQLYTGYNNTFFSLEIGHSW